jgi:non-reducing end alpha-L-arabinofuranosidase
MVTCRRLLVMSLPLVSGRCPEPTDGRHHYYAWTSSNTTSWTVLNQRDYTPPMNAKHGSMVGITDAEYGAIVARWGTPNWVRLTSSNFPDRYLRHFGYALRLDPDDNTTTFRADATFYRVAGLADSAWTSFRSYNFPDRCLRHADFLVRIDPISTATERQDATFPVTP